MKNSNITTAPRGSAALLSSTALVACLCIASLQPQAARGQEIPQNPANLTGNFAGLSLATQGVDYSDQIAGPNGALSGGPANGWLVTVDTAANVQTSTVPTLVSVTAQGGNGMGGQDTGSGSGSGGNGGDTGDINFTILSPLSDGTHITLWQTFVAPGASVVNIRSIGGNAGKGQSPNSGFGGPGGVGGLPGDINFVANQNGAAPSTYNFIFADRGGTAISLYAGGGNGGDGGDSFGSGNTVGAAGQQGQAGGNITAQFALDMSESNATGINATSVGGNGGTGGQGSSTGAQGTAGAGGAGGAGGTVSIYNSGGSIKTTGSDIAVEVTVGTPTNDPLVVTVDSISAGVIAQSLGGAGGADGGAEGWFGAGSKGGAAGNGGTVSVNLVGSGLYDLDQGYELYRDKGAIFTSGDNALGLLASSVGGAGGGIQDIGGAFAKRGGTGGVGGNGGQVYVATAQAIDPLSEYVLVTTNGKGSDGIVGQSVGGGGGAGGDVNGGGFGTTIQQGGKGGVGGNGGAVGIDNGYWTVANGINVFVKPYTIYTQGGNSHAILMQSIGGGGGRGGDAVGVSLGIHSLVIGGAGGTGGDGGEAVISNYGILQTEGYHSIGAFVQSVGGGGGAGGSALSIDIGSILTASTAVGGVGGTGGDGGTATLYNFGQIITLGPDSHALFAQSIGGGGGLGGNGIAEAFAINPPDVPFPTVTIDVSIGAQGGKGGNGDKVALFNTNIASTQGANAFGIFAQSVGGGGGSGGAATSMSQAYTQSTITVGVSIGGSGGTGGNGDDVLLANSGLVSTLGFGSHGLLAQSVGGGGGNGSVGQSNQGAFNGAEGLSLELTVAMGGKGGAGGNGGNVNVYNYIDDDIFPQGTSAAPQGKNGNGGILTAGLSAFGILAQSVGGGGGNGGNAIGQGGNGTVSVNVALGGNGGSGGQGGNVNVDAGQGAIITLGANSHAVFGQSIGGGGGNGGNANTGSGNDPQYFYSQYLFGDALKSFNNSDAQNFANGLWDWKDNVFGEWGNIGKLDKLYAGYAANNDPLAEPVEPGKGLTLSDISIDIGAGRGGGGGNAGDGGAVSVQSAGAIITRGAGSVALFGQSIGGGGGNGGASSASAGNDQLPVALLQGAINIGSKGGKGGNGGTVMVSNGAASLQALATIQTSGDMSHGMYGLSVGGGGGVSGISTSTSSLAGLLTINIGADKASGGFGAAVQLDNYGSIITAGDDAIGMIGQSIGGGGGYVSTTAQAIDPTTGIAYSVSQGSIVGNGAIIAGLSNPGSGSGGGDVSIGLHTAAQAGTVTTSGINAYGIMAQSIGGSGGVFILDSNNHATNTSTLWADSLDNVPVQRNNGGVVTVNTDASTLILTTGAGAAGIYASSIGGGGAVVNGLNGASLATYGYGLESIVPDRGGDAGLGGSVVVNMKGNITTTGTYAHGILAHVASNGGGVIGRADGTGFLMFENNQENLRGQYCSPTSCGTVAVTVGGDPANTSTIAVSGASTYGIAAISWGNPVGTNRVDLLINSNATVRATGDAVAAILIAGQNIANLTNAGTIDAGSGVAIAHVGNYALGNAGTITGSYVNAQNASFAALPGILPASVVTINNLPNGVMNAGKIVDLGTGTLTNNGTIKIGAVAGIARTVMTGNLVQAATGVINIDADLAAGMADNLAISGSAKIAGTVRVAATSISNRAVRVLTASGGVVLAPALTMADASHLYDFRSVVSGNDLSLMPVANFTAKASGLGANEKAVAANLQSLFDGGASADTAFNRLLLVANDASYAAGLKSLAGQGLGAFGAFRFNSSRTFAANLYGGCGGLTFEARQTDRCGWARVLVNGTTQQAATDTLGYNANAVAMQAGLVAPLSDMLALTGSLAYESSKFRDAGQTARITGDSVVGGVGLLYTQDKLELSAGIDAAYGWYKSSRSITLAVTEEAMARPKQSQLGGHIRASYNLAPSGKTFVRPFVEGHAIHVSNKSFAETGPSPFRLAVDGRSDTALIGVAGVEVGTLVPVSATVTLRPFASAAFEYGSPRDWTTKARFADQPRGASFDLKTAGPGTLGRFTVGADLIGSSNVAFSVQYAPEVGKDFTSHSGTARLTIPF